MEGWFVAVVSSKAVNIPTIVDLHHQFAFDECNVGKRYVHQLVWALALALHSGRQVSEKTSSEMGEV